jgi:signal transduction histidine kinase
MQVDSILICGRPTALPPCLPEALRAAFPSAAVTEVSDLAAALVRPIPAGRELLLIAEAGEAELRQAREQSDAAALPRWGVLAFGQEGVPAVGWQADTLASLLVEAAARHGADRENVRLKGDLLTMARRVSHDLRTPLGGIIATVDMLAETVPSGPALTKPVFSSIDEITRLITRTSLLLRAVAEPATPQPVAMGSLISEVIFRLSRLIGTANATINQPVAWPEVTAVPGWVELVWTNLLQNALQHGGTSPVVYLGWEEIPGAWQFYVRDQGPGPKPQGTAGPGGFLPFHVLHDRNAPKGFGLPIVQRLTELLGGQCGYEPAPDGGAVYWFTLPRP